jgi:hypothetical protein
MDFWRDAPYQRREALVEMVATATLDPGALIEEARASAGAHDLGDETLPNRLAELTEQLKRRLDVAARSQARAVIHGLLVQRLALFQARRKHVGVGDEVIDRPVIIFGEGRSGTTLLQMLLGCDVDARVPEFWEVMRPAPPPGISDTEARRREADSDWAEILALIPSWLAAHPYNAMLGRNPPECERLWAFDFRSMPPTAWWRVPGVYFPAVRLARDDVRQYEIHRMVLQHLQFRMPARRWVLKGVTHQYRLPALLAAYPDATFVWIHRDPVEAIASRFELQAQIYEALNGSLDRPAFAQSLVERAVANFTSAATQPEADDQRIHHLEYRNFTAEPIDTIRALYDSAGLEYSAAFEGAMRAWLDENPADRFGRFTYSPDGLGVNLTELDKALQPYRERFIIGRAQKMGA